jgi:DNA polymerase I-like protein with 3'-5' exonuclease and polymerase domains
MNDNIKSFELRLDENGLDASAKIAAEHAQVLASHYFAFINEFPEADSYVEMTLHDAEGRGVVVTVRRQEGETPGAKAARLERELERLRGEEP